MADRDCRTLREVVTDYISASTLKPKSLKAYKPALTDLVEHFERIGMDPKDVGYREAAAWFQSLKKRQYAGITLNGYLSAARGLWRELQALGLAEHNPFRELRNAPYSRPLPQPLTEDQVRAVIAAEEDFIMFAMWNFIYFTGFRIDVTRRLKWKHLDFTHANVKLRGKRDKEILHPLRRDLLELLHTLQRRAGESAYVFPNTKGKPIRADTIRKRLRLAATAAGLERDVRPHQLRHSIATHMHERGADIREVQEFLHHEHISTSQIYTQVSTKRLREIVDRTQPKS